MDEEDEEGADHDVTIVPFIVCQVPYFPSIIAFNPHID